MLQRIAAIHVYFACLGVLWIQVKPILNLF